MTLGTAPSSTSVRRLLRAATEEVHTDLDRAVLELDPFADNARYAAFLQTHVEARRVLRAEFGSLVPSADAAEDTAAADRALGQDLAALGGDRADAVPDDDGSGCDSGNVAAVAGLHYVLEGSLLGARYLAGEAGVRLGPAVPLTYLELGLDDNERWPRALRRVEAIGWSPEMEAAAVRAFAVHRELFDPDGFFGTASSGR